MGFSKEHTSENIYIKMDGALSIYDVTALRTEILACLQKESEPLVLDMENVSECDTAAVQFLYSVSKTAAHNEKKLRFDNIPAAVTDAMTLAGMAPHWIPDDQKEV